MRQQYSRPSYFVENENYICEFASIDDSFFTITHKAIHESIPITDIRKIHIKKRRKYFFNIFSFIGMLGFVVLAFVIKKSDLKVFLYLIALGFLLVVVLYKRYSYVFYIKTTTSIIRFKLTLSEKDDAKELVFIVKKKLKILAKK